jgi:hypothetical protein
MKNGSQWAAIDTTLIESVLSWISTFQHTMVSVSAIPPTVKIWQPLAFVHLHSAGMLCEKAVEVEAIYDGSRQSLDTCWSYVTGSIFAATAFLEALINETFVRAVIRAKGEPEASLKNLSPDIIASMAQAWGKGIVWSKELLLPQFLTQQYSKPPERWSILDKYQLALYLADKPPYEKPFEKTGKLWKDAVCLKELRNYLTHYEPETVSFSANDDPYEAETKRRTKLLRGLLKRNLQSTIYGEGSVLSFLGSECARWAVDTSTTLAKEFRDKMALDPASIPGL